MPISYSISADEDFIHEVWVGSVSIHDLQRYWDQYLQDPKVLAIRRTLDDLRQASIQFNGNDLSNLVRSMVIPRLHGKSWISALLVDQPVQYGVSRQYQVFAELFSRDAIFDDEKKAEAWLKEQVHKM